MFGSDNGQGSSSTTGVHFGSSSTTSYLGRPTPSGFHFVSTPPSLAGAFSFGVCQPPPPAAPVAVAAPAPDRNEVFHSPPCREGLFPLQSPMEASGTRTNPFQVTRRRDGLDTFSLHTITAMPAHQFKSLEELRFEDHPHLFKQHQRDASTDVLTIGEAKWFVVMELPKLSTVDGAFLGVQRRSHALEVWCKTVGDQISNVKEQYDKAVEGLQRVRDEEVRGAEEEFRKKKEAIDAKLQDYMRQVKEKTDEWMAAVEEQLDGAQQEISALKGTTTACPTSPPSELSCPLTKDLMSDPVVAPDGHTYERSAIEAWFACLRAKKLKPNSPLTRQELSSTRLTPNFMAKSMCDSFRKSCAGESNSPCKNGATKKEDDGSGKKVTFAL